MMITSCGWFQSGFHVGHIFGWNDRCFEYQDFIYDLNGRTSMELNYIHHGFMYAKDFRAIYLVFCCSKTAGLFDGFTSKKRLLVVSLPSIWLRICMWVTCMISSDSKPEKWWKRKDFQGQWRLTSRLNWWDLRLHQQNEMAQKKQEEIALKFSRCFLSRIRDEKSVSWPKKSHKLNFQGLVSGENSCAFFVATSWWKYYIKWQIGVERSLSLVENTSWSIFQNGVVCGRLGGGFKHFLFSPLFGEDSHFD